jgi:serine/threonine-protein kinase
MQIQDLPQYRPIHKIPKGGLTDLYVCSDQDGKRVVVRYVREQYRKDKAIVKAFKRGTKHLEIMDHPSIVKLLEHGTCKGVPYMVIDYHESENLRECILHQNKILTTNSLTLVRKLASALDYVHSHGYLHMDLKPENILITPKSGLVLIDFDLSLCHKGPKLVKLKIIPGTPTYLSPEALRYQMVDEGSEVFTFGVVSYELLSSHKPYEANSVSEYKHAVADLNIKAYPLHEHRQNISKELEKIIFKCLAKRRGDRYPTMSLVLRDLDALL